MMTNAERALQGAQTISTYMERDSTLIAHEALLRAIVDMLHSYCEGDSLTIDDLFSVTRARYLREFDAETPAPTPCPSGVDDPFCFLCERAIRDAGYFAESGSFRHFRCPSD
jgi:hypothetical protein